VRRIGLLLLLALVGCAGPQREDDVVHDPPSATAAAEGAFYLLMEIVYFVGSWFAEKS
jgi:hypothetical protein